MNIFLAIDPHDFIIVTKTIYLIILFGIYLAGSIQI